MKSNYYLNVTIYGLCLIPFVAIFLIELRNVFGLIGKWNFLLPIVAGYLAALAAAALADFFLQARAFLVTVLILVGVFLGGAYFGCGVNFLLNGELRTPSFGIYNEAWSWFGKPAYWLTIIGGPCAVFVAISYFAGYRLLVRWRDSREKDQACSL
jgi:hypothetical protein